MPLQIQPLQTKGCTCMMATQKQWSDLLPPSRAKTSGSQGQGNAKGCEMWRTCHEAMRPSGDLKQSSSQSFRPKRISERFLIRLPGLPAYINSFHLNGSDTHPGDGFGNHVWLSLGIGERTESQPAMLHAAEATPWIHLSARQKRRATEPSPQHLNIQTLQALSLDVLRLSSLPKKAPKTSNLLSLKPCEVTSTDVIA